jgi:LysR family transcriptional regulator of gallate degradation
VEIKQLRQFLAVMDEGNFAAAARSTGLTSQAIGRSIQKLETELGVELFERHQRSVVPTEFARTLEKHARRIIVQHRAAQEELGAMDENSFGEVRVAIGGSLAGEVGPLAICRFQEKYPRIRISLIGGLTETLIRELRRGRIDFVAGVATPDWHADEELRTENLFAVGTHVIAGRDHPLADERDLTMEQLAEYPWIVASARIGETGPLPLLEVFVGAGVKPPRRLVYSNAVSGAMGLLTNGPFLSLTVPHAVPESVLGLAGSDAPLVYLDFDWPSPSFMATLTYRAGVTLAKPAQLLANEFTQAARELYDTGSRSQ